MVRFLSVLPLLALAARPPVHAAEGKSLLLPLYEQYPVVQDFRFNQGVQSAIRWGSVGMVIGSVAGLLLWPNDEMGILPFFSLVAGGVAGTALGATSGVLRGAEWEDRRGREPSPHGQVHRVGYEIETGWDLRAGPGTSLGRELGGFALTYRHQGFNRWLPEEYQYVRGLNHWYEISDIEGRHASDDRHGIRVRKFLRDGLWNPFLGLGAGFAQGEIRPSFEEILSDAPDPGEYQSGYVEMMAGIEFNAFDLFQAKMQGSYEPYGPWQSLRDEGDFSHLSALNFRVSLGANIF